MTSRVCGTGSRTGRFCEIVRDERSAVGNASLATREGWELVSKTTCTPFKVRTLNPSRWQVALGDDV
eukprot:6046772-Prymnesium_polylepis.1